MRLVRHQRAPIRRATTCTDVLLGHAESGQLVLRQVDAPQAPVLGDVANDVDQLEGHAQRLGALRLVRPVDGDARDADGAGHPPAVPRELLERRIARLPRVLQATLDQVVER